MQVDHLSDDPLATRFFSALIRMVKGGQHQAMEVIAGYDLTMSQMRMLHQLDHAGAPLPVSAIGEALGLSAAATGRAVDAMHRAGFVSRTEDPVDRRVKRIALTDAGHEAVERITRARFAAISDFIGQLDEEDRAALGEAVETLSELADRFFPSSGPAGCAAPAPTASPTQETTA